MEKGSMYQYIPREKLQSVIDIADFPEDVRAEIAYRRFVHDAWEVLYIEEDGILLGVVSIGDLERYYAGCKDTLEINRHFSSTAQIDEEKAADFFERFRTFFELPVVNSSGRLEGVMKREIHYVIRRDQIASLVVSKHFKEQWHRRELNRFVTNTSARVVLYYTKEAEILKELASRRTNFSGENKEIFWKDLSKSQWDCFLGESGVVMSLKKEFGNFHTKMVKGVSEVVDMEGEFYRCTGGNRFTENNPENPERHVIFYGPCTIAGAYCRDGQTIESYFQKMLNMQIDSPIQVINKGLFNMTNYFSRMMTDELCEKDIVVIHVEEKWLTEEILRKCICVGNLTGTYLSIEDLDKDILDIPEHCNFKVNKRLAQRIYHDFEDYNIFDAKDLSGEPKRIQDYYIGSEIMSEVLLYMENNDLLREGASNVKGAMALLADPFTDRHKKAVEAALKKVDMLYLFISEDSNLNYTLEERIQIVNEALQDLKNNIVVVPSGKYLYTKKISRGIRKHRFCDDDMEYDCDIFGEIYGGFMGIRYRFVVNELDNPVERKYMDTCIHVLPRFGITVEEL